MPQTVDPEIEKLVTEAIGAAIEVHMVLGPGHLESHHENAFCHELDLRGIPYERQVPIKLVYKERVVGEGRLDVLISKRLVTELKATSGIADIHLATVMSYIRIRGDRLGLILNFNVPAMNSKQAIRRVICG